MFIEIKDKDVSKTVVILQNLYDGLPLIAEATNTSTLDEREFLMNLIEDLALPSVVWKQLAMFPFYEISSAGFVRNVDDHTEVRTHKVLGNPHAILLERGEQYSIDIAALMLENFGSK